MKDDDDPGPGGSLVSMDICSMKNISWLFSSHLRFQAGDAPHPPRLDEHTAGDKVHNMLYTVPVRN